MKKIFALITAALLWATPALATESVNFSTVPLVPSVTDYWGHVFTITTDGTRTVKRDGSSTGLTGVQEIHYLGHTVYALDATIGWYKFTQQSAAYAAVPEAEPFALLSTVTSVRAPVGLVTGLTCTGTAISAGGDIQAAVTANPAGTTFCLAKGTYTARSVVPKNNNVFIGEYDGTTGVTMDGNGTATQAFSGSATGVTIQNIKITNYNNSVQTGQIDETGANWTLQNNVITLSIGGAGIRVVAGALIIANHLTLNAEEGYACNSPGIIFDSNEIDNNNPSGDNWDSSEQGGGKCTQTRNLYMIYNYTHDNYYSAMWTDVSNLDTRYWFNKSVNDSAGIEHEISYNVQIIGNEFINNGSKSFDLSVCPSVYTGCGCVMIENSLGIPAGNQYAGIIEIRNNICKPGTAGRGFVGRNQNRGGGFVYYFGPFTIQNVWTHNNLTDASGSTITDGQAGFNVDTGNLEVFQTNNNRWDYNSYKVPSATSFTWMNAQGAFSYWQSFGQDLHGNSTGP